MADAIEVARLVEERNGLQKKGTSSYRTSIHGIPSKSTNSSPVGILGPPPAPKLPSGNNNNPLTFKRLTSQEAHERREKGLCYYCDEQFVQGHRCQQPQLFMMEDTAEVEDEPPRGRIEKQEGEEIAEILFHAIVGKMHPQTIRLQGWMKGRSVTVLVDSGNTHNFMDQSLVKKCGLTITNDQTFQVMVANREKIDCVGRCLALPLEIQGY